MSDDAVATLEIDAPRPVTGERAHLQIDALEAAMLRDLPAVEMPVEHRFTPGLYAREIFMPAGTLLTSKIHNTEHPYVVLTGRVSVFIDDVGVEHIAAPHVGVTKPGTRRVLYIHEDCRWITFHPINELEEVGSVDERLEKIEDRIIERRELPSGESHHVKYLEKLRAQSLDDGDLEDDVKALEPQYEYGGAP